MMFRVSISIFVCAVLLAVTTSGCSKAKQNNRSAQTTLANRPTKDTPEHWTKKIERDPAEQSFYYYRANAYAARNQHRLAIEDCDVALRLDPNYGPGYFYRGEYNRTIGNFERAVEDFTQALEKLPKYQPEYLDKIDVVYASRGAAYLRLKRYDLSLGDLDAAVEKNSNNSAAYLLRSCLHLECGKAELALQDAESAVSSESNSLTLAHLGRVLRETKRYGRALAVFNAPMTLSATTIDFFREKVTLLREMKRYKEGITLASECLKFAPHDVAFYLIRGQCYSRSGFYQSAAKDFNKAIAMSTSDSPTLRTIHFERSGAYEVLGELDKAEADLIYVANFPNEYEPIATKRHLVELLSSQQNPQKLERAVSICTELIAQGPTAFDYGRRSTLLEHKKDYTGAIADLKKASALDRSYVDKYTELIARVKRQHHKGR